MRSALVRILCLAACLLVTSAASGLSPSSVNVDFGFVQGPPSSSYGAASGQTGFWNEVGLGSTPLLDRAGAGSALQVDVSASSDTGSSTGGTGDDRLLLADNFHVSGGSTWTVDLTGVLPGDYLVYLYAPANSAVSSGDMLVNGSAVAGIPGDVVLVEGSSYVSALVSITDGTLAVSGSSGSFSGLSGLQLVPIGGAAVNVDFGFAQGPPSSSYGAASGQAGFWNEAGLGLTPLRDLEGSALVLALEASATSDGGTTAGGSGDDRLLLTDNLLASGGSTWSVDVTGVLPGDYLLYLYAPAHGSVPTGDMLVNGIAVASIPGGLTLIEGTSYVWVLVSINTGTLSISGSSGSFSGLSGLQLAPVGGSAVNIDFGFAQGPPSSGYGAASGRAGFWNEVGLGQTPLRDLKGGGPVLLVDVNATSDGGSAAGGKGDDGLLLGDNFHAVGGATWTVAVSGILPGDYLVYLYAPANSAVPSGDMLVNGMAIASVPGDFVLLDGSSHASLLVSISGGTLSISGSSGSFSGLSGLQLAPAGGAEVNIDFGFAQGPPSSSYGAASGQTGFWNQVGLGRMALVNLAGTAPVLLVEVNATSDGGSAAGGTGDDRLLLADNFHVSGGSTWTVDVTGIFPGDYLVYLYAPANGAVSSGDMLVNGSAVAGIPGDVVLVEGSSYVSAFVSITDGTLAVSGSSGSFSGLSGLQLVPIGGAAVNIDFGFAQGPPSSSYGAASGQAGFWNEAGLGLTPLLDLAGVAPVLAVETSASSDGGSVTGGTGDDRLLLTDNLLASGGSTWSVDVTGVLPGDYLVYLYAPANGSVPTGDMLVNGIAVASIPGGLTLVEGSSYVWVVVSINTGTLSISGSSGSFSGLSGLQLAPIGGSAVNVDFGFAQGPPSSGYGAASSQAGFWNEAGLGQTPLRDLEGGGPVLLVDVNATSDGGSAAGGTGDDGLLLGDNFHAVGGATWTVDVSGILPGNYLVYLYAPANSAVSSGDMLVNGSTVASIPGGFTLDASSWVIQFAFITRGRLSISGSSGSFSGLSGLQLVPIGGAAVNVDFGFAQGPPSSSYGAASGQAGFWNEVGLGQTPLLDLAGVTPVLAVATSATSDGGSTAGGTGDDGLLLTDNLLASGGTTWTVDVAGILPGEYLVYLYAPANSAVPTGDMLVNGSAVASLPGDFGLVENTSYVRRHVFITGGGLAISGSSGSFSGLSGLQVVPVPEPGSLLVLPPGLALLALLARRRKVPVLGVEALGRRRRSQTMRLVL